MKTPKNMKTGTDPNQSRVSAIYHILWVLWDSSTFH